MGLPQSSVDLVRTSSKAVQRGGRAQVPVNRRRSALPARGRNRTRTRRTKPKATG